MKRATDKPMLVLINREGNDSFLTVCFLNG